MNQGKSVRLTISMPIVAFNLLNQISAKNKRSKLIAEAVTRYAEELKKDALRKHLKEGYTARADRDREMTAEWFGIEQESYEKHIVKKESGDEQKA